MSKKKDAAEFAKDIAGNEKALLGWNFTTLGYFDYIAARQLIINGSLLAGVVLASTSIEKYLKALLAYTGKKTHVHLDSLGLPDLLRKNGIDVGEYLNENFLSYLGRAYAFRYIEPMDSAASIAIEQWKLLAELDYSIHTLDGTLNFGGAIKTNYQIALQAKTDALFADNYLLTGQPKSEFIERSALAFAIANRPNTEIMQMTIPKLKALNDGNFDFPVVNYGGNQVEINFGRKASEVEFEIPLSKPEADGKTDDGMGKRAHPAV